MYYLKTKDVTEYSGLESYVYKFIKKEAIDWIPMFKALSIQGHTNADQVRILVEAMREEIDNLKDSPVYLLQLAGNHMRRQQHIRS
jgi:hypothetical protein